MITIPSRLITDSGTASYVSLAKLAAKTGADVARLPHTIKILIENIARRAGSRYTSSFAVDTLVAVVSHCFRSLSSEVSCDPPAADPTPFFRVRGALLWNVWEQVDAARRLIPEPGPFRPENLKGRLPA